MVVVSISQPSFSTVDKKAPEGGWSALIPFTMEKAEN
jgi:hypothetical protein